MKVFIVYGYYHYDDYKRADSHGSVDGVFYNEDSAYKCAVKKFKEMFNDYAKYNWDNTDCDCHEIDPYWKDKENYLQCKNCGNALTENCNLDLTHENNLFSKEHILSILDDENKSFKEKYDFIKDNLFDNILPQQEFTMMPTHYNYTVEKFEVE